MFNSVFLFTSPDWHGASDNGSTASKIMCSHKQRHIRHHRCTQLKSVSATLFSSRNDDLFLRCILVETLCSVKVNCCEVVKLRHTCLVMLWSAASVWVISCLRCFVLFKCLLATWDILCEVTRMKRKQLLDSQVREFLLLFRTDATYRLLQQRFVSIQKTRDELETEVKEMAAAGRSLVTRMDAVRMELVLLSEQKTTYTRLMNRLAGCHLLQQLKIKLMLFIDFLLMVDYDLTKSHTVWPECVFFTCI